jgi:hypothetical protein
MYGPLGNTYGGIGHFGGLHGWESLELYLINISYRPGMMGTGVGLG